MEIELPFPPSANRYWRNFRGRMVKSAEARAYQLNAQLLVKRDTLLTGALSITMHIYRPAKRGDLDNRIKIILDALQGIAYTNDNQIVEIHASMGDDKLRPRVEVSVRMME